jgi:hypothetical protein
VLFSYAAFAQDRKILGRIFDAETQKPIKNASLVITDTTSRTFSNQLGFFELTVKSGTSQTLVASHIGYKTSQVPIPPEDRFKFSLEKEYINLIPLNLGVYPIKELVDQPQPTNKAGEVDSQGLVELDAQYPNGLIGFYGLIGNSLAAELPQGDIHPFQITFTVNETGQPINIHSTDSTSAIQAAVDRAFQVVPYWIPAQQKGNVVPQHFALPIVRYREADVTAMDLLPFYSYISNNIRYPAAARQAAIQGAVYVEFEAGNDGKLGGLQIVQDIGGGCGAEVVRVLTEAPADLVARLIEKTHHTQFVLPVCFGLQVPYKIKKALTMRNGLEVLKEVEVTAIGIEREMKVTGFGHSPTYTPPRSSIGDLAPYITHTDMTTAMRQPKSTKRLMLVELNYTAIPADVFKLANLESLDLERNKLETLPSDIQELAKLKELFLFENRLQNLPSNFPKLRRLEVLGLGSNQFKSFPAEILALEKLEELDLSDNQISDIPDQIAALSNLRVVLLRDNNIASIPSGFYELMKLETIDLQGNAISLEDKERLRATFPNAAILF